MNIKIYFDDDVKKKPKRKHKEKVEGPLPEPIPLQKREPPKNLGLVGCLQMIIISIQ
jgi:hypothetical protein